MNKDVIIIGGSKFVNTVDLKHINFEKYDIIAINRPPIGIPCHTLVAHDCDFRMAHTQAEVKAFMSQNLNPVFLAPKTEFIHETTGWKWKFDYISHNIKEKCLGFCLYTCSTALNYAYLKGYKNIYFIGVDLEENGKPFTHWHGVTNIVDVPKNCAKKAKEYLYRYKKWVNLYQCNKNVMNQWDCDYYPIDLLYNHQ